MLNTIDLDVRTEQFGPWETQISDRLITLQSDQLTAMQEVIARWLAVDPHPEDTWVQRTYGVPTLFVRFDCSVRPDGQLCFYEIEERPQGMGGSNRFNPAFAKRLAEVRQHWPAFTSVETSGHIARGGTDDSYWLRSVPWELCQPAGLLLLRSEPHEQEVWGLAERSVSTIRTEGRKHYGVDLGWWREVSHPDQLPWDEQFVLKPLQGSKSFGITLWVGSGKQNKRAGASTRRQVVNRLADHRTMLCQPYHQPRELEYQNRRHHLMLRPFFGFVPSTREWVYLGGEWLMDASVKLHGTSTTVFGPLV